MTRTPWVVPLQRHSDPLDTPTPVGFLGAEADQKTEQTEPSAPHPGPRSRPVEVKYLRPPKPRADEQSRNATIVPITDEPPAASGGSDPEVPREPPAILVDDPEADPWRTFGAVRDEDNTSAPPQTRRVPDGPSWDTKSTERPRPRPRHSQGARMTPHVEIARRTPPSRWPSILLSSLLIMAILLLAAYIYTELLPVL